MCPRSRNQNRANSGSASDHRSHLVRASRREIRDRSLTTRKQLLKSNDLLKRFSKAKVLVIGDVMIDRYYWGEISRISPEAPVPVVALQSVSLAPGGAANVAANVAGLGAKPTLFGITGDDTDAGLLPEILRNANITRFSLVAIPHRTTTVKTRIVANNQHVVRID